MGRVTVLYRFDRANRLLMGGRSLQRDISEPRERRYLIGYAERLWPEMQGVRWTHAWSGQLAITGDHYPHVHEPDESVLVCLGYNGRGVAMSTAMGPQLARRVIGGTTAEIDMPITTMKEMPFHAFVAISSDRARGLRADARLAGDLTGDHTAPTSTRVSLKHAPSARSARMSAETSADIVWPVRLVASHDSFLAGHHAGRHGVGDVAAAGSPRRVRSTPARRRRAPARASRHRADASAARAPCASRQTAQGG